MITDSPSQISLSGPASAIGGSRGTTVTTTVSLSEFPRTSVPVTIYVTVVSGKADGFSAIADEILYSGDHSMCMGVAPPVTTGSPPRMVVSP